MIELIDDLEAGELSVEFEGQRAAGAARVGARALLAADRALDRLPGRRRGAARHGVRARPGVRVFSVDTGRLPAETYELIEQLRDRYPGLELELLSPNARQVQAMVGRHGPNLFYRAGRAAAALLQRPQGAAAHAAPGHARRLDHRPAPRPVGDAARTSARSRSTTTTAAIVKLNPLAEWTEEEVWDYVRERDVPYHPLYDRGYTSIGCAPCTRALAPGEQGRDGRWWWEKNAPKECGIHCAVETGGLEHELRALLGEDDESRESRSPAGAGGRAGRGAGGPCAGLGEEYRGASPSSIAAIGEGEVDERDARRSRSCSSSASRAGASARSTGPAASRRRCRCTGGFRAGPSSPRAPGGDRGAARARGPRARVGRADARSGPARSR